MTQWLKITEVAKEMGVGERQARNRVLALQARYPHRELVRDYRSGKAKPGGRAGRYTVNPDVMRELVQLDQDETLDELSDRVGSLETYWQIIKIRLKRAEKELRGENPAGLIADLQSRLRKLEELSGSGQL